MVLALCRGDRSTIVFELRLFLKNSNDVKIVITKFEVSAVIGIFLKLPLLLNKQDSPQR